MSKLHIFALSGSLRQASHNTALLRLAASLTEDLAVFDIATPAGLPLYDGDLEAGGPPESVAALGARAAAADAVMIASPEYNFSVPGGLKNALDWLSRLKPIPIAQKPLSMMTASPSRLGGARAQYQLRHALLFLEPDIIQKPEIMVSEAHIALSAPDDRLKGLLRQHVELLAAKAAARARQDRARQDAGQ